MTYIFDMGGVVTTSELIERRLPSVLGITDERFVEICRNGRDILRLCSDGIIDTNGFWREFSARSGIEVKTDWFRYFFHPRVNQGTVKIIRALKERGFRVICGTNTISSHYQTHIERGDYTVFDQVYSSCNMGVSKPDATFWKIILEAEDLSPRDAVFIDDRQDNCDAASALGIRSILFTDAKALAKGLGVT